MIRIYTDGACANNQSEINSGGWGAILVYGEHIKKIKGGEKNTTNNRMELKAIIESLKILKRKDIPTVVYTDSAYIFNCFKEKWYLNWEKNNWRNSKKNLVLNRDLWEELLELYRTFFNIKIYKVKAHINPENKEELKREYDKIKKADQNTLSFRDFKTNIEFNNEADRLAVLGAREAEEGSI